MGNDKLPKGWEWATLNNIASINKRPDFSNISDNTEVSFLPMRCVEAMTGKIDLSDVKLMSHVKKGFTPFIDGDLIFAKITPCMENGKIAIVNGLKNGLGFGSTEFHTIRFSNETDVRLFFYYFIQHIIRKEAQRNMTGTAGQMRVPSKFLESKVIPLPPHNEQKRIVVKIEELFTKLDAGVEALKKVKAELKRYRQAVLKAAFEGKLTAEWRKTHKDKLEPASKLLERIAKERDKTAKGKAKPLPALDTSNLPDLPDGWEWTTVKNIGEVVTGTTPSKSKSEYYGDDFPFYKPTDLNEGYYVKYSTDGLSKAGLEQARLLPEKSTLITCIGATIGKTGFARIAGASNQQINAIIPEKGLLPEYIYFYCISLQFQKSIMDNASATTLPIINKRKFELLALPIPSFEEQKAIVNEIERCFSIADEVEQMIERSLKEAGRLRQSILKKAFEGKLVPQDPNDEPAEKLLETIKKKNK